MTEATTVQPRPGQIRFVQGAWPCRVVAPAPGQARGDARVLLPDGQVRTFPAWLLEPRRRRTIR